MKTLSTECLECQLALIESHEDLKKLLRRISLMLKDVKLDGGLAMHQRVVRRVDPLIDTSLQQFITIDTLLLKLLKSING